MNDVDWVKAWSKAIGAGFAFAAAGIGGVVVAPAGIARECVIAAVAIGALGVVGTTLSAQLSNPNKDTTEPPPVVVSTTPMVEAVLAAIAPHLPQVAAPPVLPPPAGPEHATDATPGPAASVIAEPAPPSLTAPNPTSAAGVAVPMPAAPSINAGYVPLGKTLAEQGLTPPPMSYTGPGQVTP